MSNTAIKVENLSKIYRLGEIGTGTISRDIERWVRTRLLRQEDPFLKIGETNDWSSKGTSDIIYSLNANPGLTVILASKIISKRLGLF